MTYAVAADIAPYVRIYTDFGDFTADTVPSEAQVTQFIADVSAIVDVLVTQNNLTVSEPSNLFSAVAAFVKGQVADLVLMINQAGRFGPTGLMAGERPDGRSAYAIITDDAAEFLAKYAETTGVGPGETVARIVMI